MTGRGPARSPVAVFSRRVSDFAGPAPHVVDRATPLAEVLPGMAAAGASSALVVGRDGRLAGILTERDIARRVALRLGGETPVEAAMTTPVLSIAADDLLYRAIGRMRRARLRHMPVVDAQGRPVGMLDLNDALAAAATRMVGQVDRLSQDDTTEGLAQAKRAQAELAQDLLDDNIPAPEIQGLVSELNLDLQRAVLRNAIAEMRAEGWGDMPVPMTLLVMGSGGRGENFLYPDQDNGFILADYADEEHGRIDPWFIALAERFTRTLDRVGFPLCKGGVMATNPLWRKTATQWREQVWLWGERRSPVAVLFADIFMDFAPAWGDAGAAQALRAEVGRMLERFPALLRAMAEDETRRGVALGLFGGLKVGTTPRIPAASTSSSTAPCRSSAPRGSTRCAPASPPPARWRGSTRSRPPASSRAMTPRSSRRPSRRSPSCCCASSSRISTPAGRSATMSIPRR
jgi:signal-transduction protein with cAMP-binding, CBS, and nucleotidyltransferase domain